LTCYNHQGVQTDQKNKRITK